MTFHPIVSKGTPMNTTTELPRTDITRRRLMALAGLSGIGAIGTVFSPESFHLNRTVAAGAPDTGDAGMADHSAHAETSPTEVVVVDEGPMTFHQMDEMHEAGIKAFPAPTAGVGNQPLEFVLDGDVKVFNITAKIIEWEYDTGKTVLAWAYNNQVPGPEIRVTEGDKIRVVLKNELTESTAIHWHGLIVPNDQDGVPFITQPIVKPGETFTYEFPIRVGNAGAHMYHSHANAAKQVPLGLLGAFIVEPLEKGSRPAYDIDYTLILNDGPIGGYSINGKSFPATAPLTAKKGQKLLIRYMNEGSMIHPMHLHGMPQQVIAQDGWLVPQPYYCDTINVAPGQRWEVLVDATELGTWAFHCHILSHAENDHGMFGMVTVLIVTE